MITQRPKFQSVAWTWAAGWMLVSLGVVLSGVYNSPNRGLTAFYGLGFAGWVIGAAGTIRYVHQRFGADARMIALSAVGWGGGALVAVLLGLFWMFRWDTGFLGPLLAAALGGAIGGAFTLPLRSLSSPAAMLRMSLRGAFSWGLAFLVFQFLAFYAGYILMQLTINPLLPLLGEVWAGVPGLALPAGVCGFTSALLALLASKWIQINER
jgi:hypothetical protein